jgi:hypothetical protein
MSLVKWPNAMSPTRRMSVGAFSALDVASAADGGGCTAELSEIPSEHVTSQSGLEVAVSPILGLRFAV